jgi:uncharacterized protein (TIGR03382 family)
MKLKSNITTLLVAISAGTASATVSLTTLDSTITTTFGGFTAPDPWSNDGGTGGALDYNTWAFSTGTRTQVAADFGDTVGVGRGTSTGGVGANGIYAFTVAPGVTAIGFQATGGFGSPGSFTIRLQNNTGDILSAVNIAYTAWYYNDAPREGVLRPYYSLTNDGTAGSYLQADGSNSDINSPAVEDASPAWVSNDRGFTITGLDLEDDDFLYFRFGFNDSGSGTRDEWAISSFSVTAIPEPSTALLGGLGLLALLRRRR